MVGLGAMRSRSRVGTRGDLVERSRDYRMSGASRLAYRSLPIHSRFAGYF